MFDSGGQYRKNKKQDQVPNCKRRISFQTKNFPPKTKKAEFVEKGNFSGCFAVPPGN